MMALSVAPPPQPAFGAGAVRRPPAHAGEGAGSWFR
jgi:hypothetical protein